MGVSTLTPEEQTLVTAYRRLSAGMRMAVLDVVARVGQAGQLPVADVERLAYLKRQAKGLHLSLVRREDASQSPDGLSAVVTEKEGTPL